MSTMWNWSNETLMFSRYQTVNSVIRNDIENQQPQSLSLIPAGDNLQATYENLGSLITCFFRWQTYTLSVQLLQSEDIQPASLLKIKTSVNMKRFQSTVYPLRLSYIRNSTQVCCLTKQPQSVTNSIRRIATDRSIHLTPAAIALQGHYLSQLMLWEKKTF